MNIALIILASIFALDLLFLIVQIFGNKASDIVSWICYPIFGAWPFSLFWGFIFRLFEAAFIFFVVGHII